VAIPVVVLLNWLERCVDHLAHEMDNLVTQVFTKDLSAASDTVGQFSTPTVEANKDSAQSPHRNAQPRNHSSKKPNSHKRSSSDTPHAASI
jgi:biopolymer transport protein ExbB